MSSIASTQRASNRCDAVCSFNHPTNGESSLYRSFDDIHPSLQAESYCASVSTKRQARRVIRVGSIALTFAANPCSCRLSTRMVCAMGAYVTSIARRHCSSPSSTSISSATYGSSVSSKPVARAMSVRAWSMSSLMRVLCSILRR